ncbi:MAG: hypothetical protein E6L03_09005 [Thaumarchaeota archaeon]|nr:MAG: hypothetical protein E6L03_09005 [Nitrososphaerota archaeon]
MTHFKKSITELNDEIADLESARRNLIKADRDLDRHHKIGNPKPLHFRSMRAYKRYLAFIHIHHVSKGQHNPVFIKGRKHEVIH